jgi:hypothetical protein
MFCLQLKSRDNSVQRRLTGRTPGFNSWQKKEIFVFYTTSTQALTPTVSYPVGIGPVSSRLKRLGREADHSLPHSAQVKNVETITSTPYVFVAWSLIRQ